MATDAGIKLTVDGEKAFKTSLAAINAQIKNLSSEMGTVVSEFAGMEKSEESIAKKSDVLQRSIAATNDKIAILESAATRARSKLDALGKEADSAAAQFGKNSEEATKAQNAYNRQVAVLNRLKTQINGAKTSMNRMQKEMRELGDEADNAAKDLKEAGNAAKGAGGAFKGAFLGGAISGAVQSLAGSISSLVESTTEYRKIMGTLEVSSQKAGYSASQTAQTYRQLYGVLGDTQTAATATANLQALGLSQGQLTQLTDGAIGAWATYGDSIPIDGLAEAINETVQAGAVTGTFADVLNWAGTNEDDFNEKLQAAGSASERANLVLQELADQGLMQAAEGWRETNGEIVAANLATADMSEATAELGERLSPVVTEFKEGVAELVLGFFDLLDSGSPVIPLLTGLATGAAVLAVAMNFSNIVNALSTAMTTLNTAMAANPIGLVVSLLAALVAAFITAYTTSEEFRNKVNAAVGNVKEFVGNAVQRVNDFFNKDIPDAIKDGEKHLTELPEKLKQIGKDIVQGLIDGIKNKIKDTKDAVLNLGDSIIQTAKGFFGIHSPAKKPRKEIGQPISEGIALGITDGKKEVDAAVNDLGYTIQEDLDQMISEVERKQSSLSDALSGYGKLFERTKDELGADVFSLENLEEQIKEIEDYGNALSTLKAKGVSGSLLDEVLGMSIEDATDYMNELLSMTDDKLQQYIVLYEKKQKTAATIAEQFYHNQLSALKAVSHTAANDAETTVADAVKNAQTETSGESIQSIVDGMTEQEPVLTAYITDLKNRMIALIKSFYGEYKGVGENLMTGIAEGIKNGESGVVNQMIKSLRAAVRAARKEMDIHSPSGVTEEIGYNMARGVDVGWTGEFKNVLRHITGSMQGISTVSAQQAQRDVAATVNKRYGDLIFNVANLNNRNNRDVKTFARELSFLMQQQDAGKGQVRLT